MATHLGSIHTNVTHVVRSAKLKNDYERVVLLGDWAVEAVHRRIMKFLYHKNCSDGFMAAFLFYLAFHETNKIEFIEATYGDPIPEVEWDKDELVVIADFSFPPEILSTISEKVDRIIMLDHHKTAEANFKGITLPDNVTAIFDMEKCGARLTFKWIKNATPPGHFRRIEKWEWLVGYVEDRDLWKWQLDHSQEVSAAIMSWPRTFEAWAAFDYTSLKVEGSAILRYQNQTLEYLLKNAVRETDGSMSVNSPVLQSELGNKLCEDITVPYAILWYKDEKCRTKVGLRSSAKNPNAADVSEIAKKRGGGGHKHAAGYILG